MLKLCIYVDYIYYFATTDVRVPDMVGALYVVARILQSRYFSAVVISVLLWGMVEPT